MRYVDGFDRGVDIGIRGEQHAARQWIQLARLRQEVVSLESRHPLIADDDGERIPACLQFANRGERLLTGRRADDRVRLSIMRAQIAPHRREYLRVVVNGQEYGFVHGRSIGRTVSATGSETRNSVLPGAVSTSISASL